jgi:hypothetical protein
VATVMSEQIPQIYLEYQKKSDLIRGVAKRLALIAVDEEKPVFQPASMPFFFSLQPSEYSERLDLYYQAFPDKTSDIVRIEKKQDGDTEHRVISCIPGKNEFISLSSLDKCKFSKPLSVHWFVGRYRATACAKDVDETDFLSLLAKASMGKLVVKEKSMRIDLDPTQFRKLYIDWAKAKIDHPKDVFEREAAQKMRWTLAIETMNLLTDDEIARMMSQEDSTVTIDANRTLKLQMVVRDYFNVVSQYTLGILHRQFEDGGENIYEQAIQDIDFSRPAQIEFRATGQCGVSYWRKSVKDAMVSV